MARSLQTPYPAAGAVGVGRDVGSAGQEPPLAAAGSRQRRETGAHRRLFAGRPPGPPPGRSPSAPHCRAESPPRRVDKSRSPPPPPAAPAATPADRRSADPGGTDTSICTAPTTRRTGVGCGCGAGLRMIGRMRQFAQHVALGPACPTDGACFRAPPTGSCRTSLSTQRRQRGAQRFVGCTVTGVTTAKSRAVRAISPPSTADADVGRRDQPDEVVGAVGYGHHVAPRLAHRVRQILESSPPGPRSACPSASCPPR